MIQILISAILFGMVHPCSKYFLDQGISLELFCLLYLGIRFIIQIPHVLKTKQFKISSKKDLKLALQLGLIGGLLLLTEFSGISRGENVSTVTFLVYTHPIWSLLLNKTKKINSFDIFQVGLAVFGVIALLNFSISFKVLSQNFPSIVAGLLIALWVMQSSRCKQAGFSSIKLSFYYDLFSFLVIIIYTLIVKPNALSTLPLVLIKANFVLIAIYSLGIGLLPNILFYNGASKVSPMTAGYILLLEPVVSSLISSFWWGESLSDGFLLGSICILFLNVPRDKYKILFEVAKPSFISLLLWIAFSNDCHGKTIHLFEVIPREGSDYTISLERKQIEIAAKLAFRKIDKTCNVQLVKTLKTGSEEDIVKELKSINFSGDEVIVGLSRSNFARVAAKACVGTKAKAISIGAAASNLASINNSFVTIVNPIESQFDKIIEALEIEHCAPGDTLAVFDDTDYLSAILKYQYTQKFNSKTFSPAEFSKKALKRCVLLGLKFSESSRLFNEMKKWSGVIVGIGDWNINSAELYKSLDKLSKNTKIYAPTGWLPDINTNSLKFREDFFKAAGFLPSPIAAYTYDGIFFASAYLCSGVNVFKNAFNNNSMLRNYTSLLKTGNMESPMYLKTFQGRSL